MQSVPGYVLGGDEVSNNDTEKQEEKGPGLWPWLIGSAAAAATGLVKIAWDHREPIIAGIKEVGKDPRKMQSYQAMLRVLTLLFENLELMILGDMDVGKSTLKRRLLGLPEPVKSEHTSLERHREFSFTDPNTGIKISGRIQDVGGESPYQDIWRTLLLENKPTILIFMVDHEKPEMHREALTLVQQQYFYSPVLREKCRGMLFLVNKSDLWGQGMSRDEMSGKADEIIGGFADILERFEVATVVTHFCCAKQVPPDHELVLALSKLFQKIVGSSKVVAGQSGVEL
jgi:GTPase SAR1 family protein